MNRIDKKMFTNVSGNTIKGGYKPEKKRKYCSIVNSFDELSEASYESTEGGVMKHSGTHVKLANISRAMRIHSINKNKRDTFKKAYLGPKILQKQLKENKAVAASLSKTVDLSKTKVNFKRSTLLKFNNFNANKFVI